MALSAFCGTVADCTYPITSTIAPLTVTRTIATGTAGTAYIVSQTIADTTVTGTIATCAVYSAKETVIVAAHRDTIAQCAETGTTAGAASLAIERLGFGCHTKSFLLQAEFTVFSGTITGCAFTTLRTGNITIDTILTADFTAIAEITLAVAITGIAVSVIDSSLAGTITGFALTGCVTGGAGSVRDPGTAGDDNTGTVAAVTISSSFTGRALLQWAGFAITFTHITYTAITEVAGRITIATGTDMLLFAVTVLTFAGTVTVCAVFQFTVADLTYILFRDRCFGDAFFSVVLFGGRHFSFSLCFMESHIFRYRNNLITVVTSAFCGTTGKRQYN